MQMAIFHVDLSNGKKGQTINRCDYINRESKYSGKKDLVAKGAVNLPSWAKNARDFFDKADLYERKNGNPFKQLIVSLPSELSNDENEKIVKEILEKLLGNNKVGAWAIHSPLATTKNITNVHAHIMFSERTMDTTKPIKPANLFFKRYAENMPEDKRGYPKDLQLARHGKQATENTKALRKIVETAINNGYERAGLDIKVTMKSLEEQKNNAIKEGDFAKASMLNREAINKIPTKKWYVIKNLIGKLKPIDFNQPIPLMPSSKNKDFYKTLLNEDIEAFESLIKFLEKQNKKIQKESHYYISQGNKEIQKAEKENVQTVSGIQLQNILLSISSKIKSKISQNQRRLIFHQRLFRDSKAVANVINNVLTKGEYRRYLKLKERLQATKKHTEELKSKNQLSHTQLLRAEEKIYVYQEAINEMQAHIKAINQGENLEKRYDRHLERLKKYYPKSLKQANEANQKIQNYEPLEKIMDNIIKAINEKPGLKIALNEVKNLELENPAKLTEQLKALQEKIDKFQVEPPPSQKEKTKEKVKKFSEDYER